MIFTVIETAAAAAALIVPAALVIYGQRFRRHTPRPLAAETMRRMPDDGPNPRWEF
jgi:hypothetical protein